MAATKKTNGDYVIVTSIRANVVNQGNNNDKIAIIELSGTNGNVISNQLEVFEGSGSVFPEEIVSTSSGGLVIGGEIEINGQRDIFLLELDAAKNLVKTAFYGDSSIDDYFSKIIQTTDGGYLFTGIQPINNTYSHLLAIKLDVHLNTEWAKKSFIVEGGVSGIKSTFQINIVELPGGKGYTLLAGRPARGYIFVDRPQSYLLQLDNLGNFEDAIYFGTSSDTYDPVLLLDGVLDGDGGMTFLAYSLFKHYLFNVDENNNVNWAQELTGIPVETPLNTKIYQTSLIRAGDGGYLVSLPERGGNLSHLYKTDKLGMINCDSKSANIYLENDVLSYFIKSKFNANYTDFTSNLSTNSTIIFLQSLAFNPSPSNLPVQTNCAFQSVAPVIASFWIEDCLFEPGANPLFVNNSQGDEAHAWLINGVYTPFPFSPFNEPGDYKITLIAYNSSGDTSSVCKTINIFSSCPGDLIINDTLSGFGIHESGNTITSASRISAGAEIIFSAGREITLMPDFHAVAGADFLAQIDSCQSPPSCREADSLVLVILYHATQGVSWTNTWDLSTPINNWHGITLNSEGCVIDIHLGSNNLINNIPPELGNLSNLLELHFYNNNLSGSIPSELGNLSNLLKLDIHNNNLSGNIPSEIGDLSNLELLNLQVNQLSNSIPPEIGNLVNLKELSFRDNQLSGTIPASIGNLVNLESLYLSSNQLSGTIPVIIGNLINLEFLSLGNNQLSGNIPPEIGNLINLDLLSLKRNQLSGSIPLEIGNLIKLQSLLLDNNAIIGSIPSEIGNLNSLKFLLLNNNQLSGNIPPELGNLNLSFIRLNVNQLSGCFPQALLNICSASTKDFSNNPNLPGGGDFDAFCANGTGGCSSFAPSESASSRNNSTNTAQLNKVKLSLSPNPVRKEAIINYELSALSKVNLVIYSAQGKVLRTLYRQQVIPAGRHQEILDTSPLPNGMYFIRLATNSHNKMLKMIVSHH